MSKWLREKQMTAFEVTYQGQDQEPAGLGPWGRVSLRDRRAAGPDERINFRDVVNVVSGLVLGQRFADISPGIPPFSVLVTEANRKQLMGNALRCWPVALAPRMPHAVLDALEVARWRPRRTRQLRYAQEVLNRLKAKGHGQVLNRSELLSGRPTSSISRRSNTGWNPTCWSPCWAAWSIPATSCCRSPATRSTPASWCSWQNARWRNSSSSSTSGAKEINLAVLRAPLFELFDLPSGLAQKASRGDTEPVIKLQEKVSALVPRVLKAGSDLQQGKLGFLGPEPAARRKAKDWHARLDSLKKFTESLAPYNTVGKLKNLRVTQEDLDGQKKNLEILAAVGVCSNWSELGSTASTSRRPRMVLPAGHQWVKQAETARKALQEN